MKINCDQVAHLRAALERYGRQQREIKDYPDVAEKPYHVCVTSAALIEVIDVLGLELEENLVESIAMPVVKFSFRAMGGANIARQTAGEL